MARSALRTMKQASLCCMCSLCAFLALALDGLSFLAAPASRPQVQLRKLVPADDQAGSFATEGISEGNGARASALGAAMAAFIPALCWSICSAAGPKRHRVQPTRSRHVRCLFGGKKEEPKPEEGAANEEAAEEELSEAAKEKCKALQLEVDELNALVEDKKASYDRIKLEDTNYRNRTRQELAAARGKAAVPLIKEILPIADDFERAKQNIKLESEGEQKIADRFEGLFTSMVKNLELLGLEKLESVGQDFNPELHEAVSMIPSQEYNADVVCAELRGGWVLKTLGVDEPEVLRPSLVCVSSGPGPS